MKRVLVVGGSVGVVVLLVLAMFPSVVGARSVKSGFVEWFSEVESVVVSGEHVLFFRDVDDTYGSGTWYPGFFILALLYALFIGGGLFLFYYAKYRGELRN